jgi:hypothetical protein
MLMLVSRGQLRSNVTSVLSVTVPIRESTVISLKSRHGEVRVSSVVSVTAEPPRNEIDHN